MRLDPFSYFWTCWNVSPKASVGHGLADAERIANGEHQIADLEGVGMAQINRGKPLVAVLYAQHRKIGVRVLEHEVGIELALVCEGDLYPVGIFDDVVVRDDETGRIDHDARSQRALDLLAGSGGSAAEEATKIGSSNSGTRSWMIRQQA
jgi:hypothetical protein